LKDGDQQSNVAGQTNPGRTAQAGDPDQQGNSQEIHATRTPGFTASPTRADVGTFIKNHTGQTWTCDFVQTYDLFFRTVFVFFIIELESRRVVLYGVTRSPSDVWVTQQVREATPYDERPRFLIRDNGSKYGPCFTRVVEDRQIDVLRTPVRAPKANAICKRFIGSVRRECVDHILILIERHLHRVIGEYVAYCNHALLITVLVSAYRTRQTIVVMKTWEDRHLSSDTPYSGDFTTTTTGRLTEKTASDGIFDPHKGLSSSSVVVYTRPSSRD
jgi:transposase InsO family protein